MLPKMSAPEARRAFLSAQGLARARGRRRPGITEFRAYLEQQGVVQLDTVTVLERAHYLPIFSRHGAYSKHEWDAYLWGDADGHSAHCFEHWGHEASVMPLDVLPLMHHRMENPVKWWSKVEATLERERPGLIALVRDAVEKNGPVTSAEIEHLAPRGSSLGDWWDVTPVKAALDQLFITGQIARTRARNFGRTYDSTLRAWGLEPAGNAGWAVPKAEAQQALFDRALTACGIGTAKDLCDHFRLRASDAPATDGSRQAGRGWGDSAVERGLATWVAVEGWEEPALLATGAEVPSRATASALLSPFDPACWYRPRLSRMFGMDYTIEIYVPAARRKYGYYVLPFLLGDQMAARVDLKADRKKRTLHVRATWSERHSVRSVRRRAPAAVAEALGRELRTVATWLELESIDVADHGDLAPDVARVLATD